MVSMYVSHSHIHYHIHYHSHIIIVIRYVIPLKEKKNDVPCAVVYYSYNVMRNNLIPFINTKLSKPDLIEFYEMNETYFNQFMNAWIHDKQLHLPKFVNYPTTDWV